MAETSGPQLPPIDPKKLVDTAIAVLRNPTEFFKGIKGEAGFQKCLLFSVAAGAVWGVLAGVGAFLWRLVYGQFFDAITGLIGFPIGGVILGLVGAFVGGFVVWGISNALGSKASWEPSIPIAAYAMAVMPAFAVGFLLPGRLGQFVGFLASLAGMAYGVYVCVMGAKVINFEPPPAETTPTPPTL